MVERCAGCSSLSPGNRNNSIFASWLPETSLAAGARPQSAPVLWSGIRVGRCEALACKPRPFDFIHERRREVASGDPALAVGIKNRLIARLRAISPLLPEAPGAGCVRQAGSAIGRGCSDW